jgi:hypothetical protein
MQHALRLSSVNMVLHAQARPLNDRERDGGFRNCISFDEATQQVVLSVSAATFTTLPSLSCVGDAAAPGGIRRHTLQAGQHRVEQALVSSCASAMSIRP